MSAVRWVWLAAVGSVCLASFGCGGGGGRTTSTGDLQVAAKCQSDSSQSEIRVAFKVLDTSDRLIDLGAITVRYYFSHMITTGAQPTIFVEYTQTLLLTDISAVFSDAYVDIDFSPTAGQLQPADPSGSGEIQVRFSPVDFSSWNASQQDDYSFVACAAGTTATDYLPRPTMTAYVAGKLAWGIEP